MDNDTSTLEDVITYIGMVTVSWALTEKMMDTCIHHIFSELGGDSIENEKPIALERKYKFLKKCAQRIQSLESSKSAILELVGSSKPISDKRHIFIHGCVDSWTSQSIRIRKLKTGNDFENELHDFNINQLQELVLKMQELTNDWILFACQFLPVQSLPEWLEQHRQARPHLFPNGK